LKEITGLVKNAKQEAKRIVLSQNESIKEVSNYFKSLQIELAKVNPTSPNGFPNNPGGPMPNSQQGQQKEENWIDFLSAGNAQQK